MKNALFPDYPRIPHLPKSNVTDNGDIVLDSVPNSFVAWVQEKIDGANCGVSWYKDSAMLRNREHILRKGYPTKTPAKQQFVPAWNWVHSHKNDIQHVMEQWDGQVCIFGEWLLLEHTLHYDKLPDLFIAYDIYSCDDRKFISPKRCEQLLSGTSINYIAPKLMNILHNDDIANLVNSMPSAYRNGNVEGVVMKIVEDASDEFVKNMCKFVRSGFKPIDNWNKRGLIKNELVK